MATYYWVGGSGTWDNVSTTNWSATSGGAGGAGVPNNLDTAIFDTNSGTAAVVTVASTAVSLNTTINKADINLSLSGSPTLCPTNGSLNLTAGTITLNNFILTTGFWVSSNTNIRSIAFGTSGELRVTGNNTQIYAAADITNFSYTGTSKVNFTYAGGTGTRTIRHGNTAGGSEANALNFHFSAGTDTVAFTGAPYIRTLDFTGFAGTWTNVGSLLYGNLIVSSGMTVGAGTGILNLTATSGTQQITTAGKTLDFPISKIGVGGTVQLQDNLTMGSTRTFTLTAGTLDLNNQTLSTGLFSSSNSNTRSIAFGTGNITVTGNGAGVWSTSTATNFTYTGIPTVNCTYSGATGTRTIRHGSTAGATEANSPSFNITAGTDIIDIGGFFNNVNFTGFGAGSLANTSRTIYGDLTISSSMSLTAGANATTFAATSGIKTITTAGKTFDFPLTFNGIGGTFAFQDALTQGSTRNFTITNGTVQLKNGVTSTVGNFLTSGTNQKFLQSTSPGSQATLFEAAGTVNASYLTIRDINATGGATWNAFVNQQNVDAGNNDGWDFGISPIVGSYEYTYQLRSFTQPRRF